MAERRQPAELARDRHNISRLYLAGMFQADIAADLGISQSTVSRDLRYLQAEWQAASIHNIDERKRIELARIDNLELEYWDAWRRSQQDAEVETTKAQGVSREKDAPPDKVEKMWRKEGQAGDPRFLDGVMKCINKRCELLGLDAPKESKLTGDLPVAVTIYLPDNKRDDSDS